MLDVDLAPEQQRRIAHPSCFGVRPRHAPMRAMLDPRRFRNDHVNQNSRRLEAKWPQCKVGDYVGWCASLGHCKS